jgi:phenylalanyl-tRNA synthetase alpha chain
MTLSDPDLQRIHDRFEQALSEAATIDALVAVRHRFLSRGDGEATLAVKAIGQRPPEARRTFGAEANALKRSIEERLAAREAELQANAPIAGALDVTLPGVVPPVGRRHLLTDVRERIEDIFASLGYEIIEGPELEDDWHNFEALNMPPEHPARDMQDTLYLAAPVPSADGGRPATLLRTHTSGMQIRHMEAHPPPVRLIAIGRVYRRDDVDATHSPMFTQVEGLVVDEGVSLADLKGTLQTFADRFFSAGVRTRFRPSFFPYTEPSAELDVECQGCHGAGCPLCKHTGWIEVLGCGMVHPAVFEAVGYDAERYTGFAFGIGIERLALRLYGLDDIRAFFDNDIRLLGQVAP